MTPYQKTLAIRQEAKDFLEAFGPQAAGYLAQGLTFAQATSRHIEYLQLANERLRMQLELSQSSERVPLSSGGADLDPSLKRQGFQSRLKGPNL